MLIPELMADELAKGYLGRLKECNGYATMPKAIDAFRNRYGGNLEGSLVPLPYALAIATGLTSEAFCRHHTMLPFYRAVTNFMPEVFNGAPGAVQTMPHGMSTPDNITQWCLSCVLEDLDFWGYAYYRRSHQLPGVMCCTKHREVLVGVPTRAAFDVQPGMLAATEFYQEIEPSILDHPVVSRYITITESWLTASRPIPLSNMLMVLVGQAKAVGVRRSRVGNKALLSDLALDTCPRPWLESLVPNMKWKERNVFLSPLDHVFNTQSAALKSAYYALTLALLFDTAEEALNRVRAGVQTVVPVRKAAKRMGEGFWSSPGFVEHYVECGGSPIKIAKSLQMDDGYIRTMMQKNGFPALSQVSQPELQALIDFQQGVKLADACQRHGVDIQSVEDLIRAGAVRFGEAVRVVAQMRLSSPGH